MAGRLPSPNRKPPAKRRHRGAVEPWTVLPVEGCRLKPPAWPFGRATTAQRALWTQLWRLPVAAWWHEQQIEPHVVATYVALVLDKPSHASTIAFARELALTPAAMQRMRLFVEQPELEDEEKDDPYAHLRDELDEEPPKRRSHRERPDPRKATSR